MSGKKHRECYYAGSYRKLKKQATELIQDGEQQKWDNLLLRLQVDFLQWQSQGINQMQQLEVNWLCVAQSMSAGNSEAGSPGNSTAGSGDLGAGPLSTSVCRSMPPSTTFPRAQQVSISVLPPASNWDEEWLMRLRGMQVGDVHDLLRSCAQKVSLMLTPAMAGGVGSRPYNELQDMINNLNDVWRYIAPNNGAVLEAWMSYNIETGHKESMPQPEWWEQMLRRVKVSKESIQRCVAAELMYRRQAARLIAEQKAIQSQLQGTLLPILEAAPALSPLLLGAPQQGSTLGDPNLLAAAAQQVRTLGLGASGVMEVDRSSGLVEPLSWQWPNDVGPQNQGHLLQALHFTGGDGASTSGAGAVAAQPPQLSRAVQPSTGHNLGAELALTGTSTDDLAKALERNLKKQLMLYVHHSSYCGGKGLSPVEAAQVYLACYPFTFPAARAIYNCLVPL